MGMAMSFISKGLPKTQMLNMFTGALYRRFMEKDIKNFDEFHMAILDMFNTLNAGLPGTHYDVPPVTKVQEFFDAKWKDAPETEKKKLFVDFMYTHVTMSKPDDVALFTGIVTPPAAMAAKRAGENFPQLKMMKLIPDVVFVPSVTIFAIISAKVSKKMFSENGVAA